MQRSSSLLCSLHQPELRDKTHSNLSAIKEFFLIYLSSFVYLFLSSIYVLIYLIYPFHLLNLFTHTPAKFAPSHGEPKR